MRSPSKQDGDDRRKTERRGQKTERRSDVVRGVAGERREVEQRGVATAMVDALEDILKWERASERAMKVAPSTASLENATS